VPRPDVLGQCLDGSLSPAIGRDPSADVLADAPVKIDQLRVDGSEGPNPRCFDELKYGVEVGS
jgi:hypothetical protein